MKYTLLLLSLAYCSRIGAQSNALHSSNWLDTSYHPYLDTPTIFYDIGKHKFKTPTTILQRVEILELQNQALTRLLSETKGKLDSLIGEMRDKSFADTAWRLALKPGRNKNGAIIQIFPKDIPDTYYYLITQ